MHLVNDGFCHDSPILVNPETPDYRIRPQFELVIDLFCQDLPLGIAIGIIHSDRFMNLWFGVKIFVNLGFLVSYLNRLKRLGINLMSSAVRNPTP
jgi:hypothetical protein